MTPVSNPAPRRADARRNREALVHAARQVFDEQGADAPLDDIARRAGVGNATMYRHFPARCDLVVAVYAEEVSALEAEGQARLTDDSPDGALFRWLATFIDHVATKRALATAVPEDSERSALFAQWHQQMHEIAAALLDRARRAGAVPPDLDEVDLLALANGIALSGVDTDQRERLLRLIRRGVSGRE